MDRCVENVMEWIVDQKVGSVTFSQKRYISKLKKYAEEYPDDVEIIAENTDGSITAHVPVSWFKLSPPRKGREFTEEEKEMAAERLRIAREKKNVKTDQ